MFLCKVHRTLHCEAYIREKLSIICSLQILSRNIVTKKMKLLTRWEAMAAGYVIILTRSINKFH